MGGQVQLLGQLQFAGAQPYLLTERKLHAPGFRVWFVQFQQPLGLTATADCCCCAAAEPSAQYQQHQGHVMPEQRWLDHNNVRMLSSIHAENDGSIVDNANNKLLVVLVGLWNTAP
jgi:hypothetical protein